MTTVFSEGRHAGEFLVSQANGHRSRASITVGAGADLVAGTVLGRVTASGKYVILAPAASDGSETAAAVLWDAAPAAAADVKAAAIVRDAEVNAGELVWPAGIEAAEKTAATLALAGLGIIAR